MRIAKLFLSILFVVGLTGASGPASPDVDLDVQLADGSTQKVHLTFGEKPLDKLTRDDVRAMLTISLGDQAAQLSSEERTRVEDEIVGHIQSSLRYKKSPDHQHWHFSGPLGTFDRMALQRGYQVYREVCASCHSMDLIAFRNLSDPGGPGFSEDEVKALAAQFTYEDGPDEFGDMFDRPGKPSDYFPNPYTNENQGRAANGGALPPDLSLITKARKYGPDYVYALMTGYDKPVPPLVEMQVGLYYNPYFSGRQIAMPNQLFPEMVEYADGTVATQEQMAKDVVEFLTWAGEPKMEARKAMAIPVLAYLFILTILMYMSYKRLWRNIDH